MCSYSRIVRSTTIRSMQEDTRKNIDSFKRSRTSWDRSLEMLRITEMRKVGNAIRAKEINGSWFEHGRLRMEGDYKLGLEAKQPKRVHSTRQCIHIYVRT